MRRTAPPRTATPEAVKNPVVVVADPKAVKLRAVPDPAAAAPMVPRRSAELVLKTHPRRARPKKTFGFMLKI